MIQIIVLALPILGIIGYFIDSQELFWLGAIGNLLFTLIALFTRQLAPRSIKWIIVASMAGWIITSSFINGVLLGCCFVTAFSSVIAVFIMLFMKKKL